MELLEITGFCFDAIVWTSFCTSILGHFGTEPGVSDVTQGDSGGIAMTTSARSRVGEFKPSEWLQVLSHGAGLVAPPIGEHFCTVMFFWSGDISYIWAVYTGGNQLELCQ